MTIRQRAHAIRCGGVALAAAAAALAALASSASAASYTGEFARFDNCPVSTTGVHKCLYSVTEGGEVVLGNKKVPITKAVTLQGGYSKANSEYASAFYGATNGETLSKTKEELPGGLLGIVPEKNNVPLVELEENFYLKSPLNEVNATLELADPASDIVISELGLILEEGVALELPVKVHLENLFLGSKCYIGSSSSPIILELTTGTTSPPAPNTAISGNSGELNLLEEGEVAQLTGNELVENAWSAPAAEGCGGVISFLVDPIIDAELGTTTAGHNTAILKNTVYDALAKVVSEH